MMNLNPKKIYNSITNQLTPIPTIQVPQINVPTSTIPQISIYDEDEKGQGFVVLETQPKENGVKLRIFSNFFL